MNVENHMVIGPAEPPTMKECTNCDGVGFFELTDEETGQVYDKEWCKSCKGEGYVE